MTKGLITICKNGDEKTTEHDLQWIEIRYSMDKSDNLFSLHETMRSLFLLVNALYLVRDVCWFFCKFFLWFLKTHKLLLVFSPLVFDENWLILTEKVELKTIILLLIHEPFWRQISFHKGFLSTCNFPIICFLWENQWRKFSLQENRRNYFNHI